MTVSFDPIFHYTTDQEGKVLEQVPGDNGGMTFWGISRVNNPDWAGWPIIDGYLKAFSNIDLAASSCNKDKTLLGLVLKFYQDLFNQMGLSKLNYQELATQVFDKNFNMGGIAIKIFQLLVGARADGVIGPETIMRANSTVDQSGLVDRFLDWARAHYLDIVARHPEDSKFLQGWENRCTRSDKT
jgi:lysozyme family protein